MKPFDAEAKCPKCGHDKVKTTYVPKRTLTEWRYGGLADGEHMERRCDQCRFAWPEKPIKESK